MEQATSGKYFLPTTPPPGPPSSLPTTAQRPTLSGAARRPFLTPQPRLTALLSIRVRQALAQAAAQQCSTIPQTLAMRILLIVRAPVLAPPQQFSLIPQARPMASLPMTVVAASPAVRLRKVVKQSSSTPPP